MPTIDRRVFQVFRATVSEGCSWETWQQLDSLQEFVALDSVAILEFLVGLEREFQIRFAPEELDQSLLTSRPRLLRHLADRLEGKSC